MINAIMSDYCKGIITLTEAYQKLKEYFRDVLREEIEVEIRDLLNELLPYHERYILGLALMVYIKQAEGEIIYLPDGSKFDLDDAKKLLKKLGVYNQIMAALF